MPAYDLEKIMELLKTDNPEIQRYAVKTETWTEDDVLGLFRAAGKARGIEVKIDEHNRNCILQLMRWLLFDPKFTCLSSDGKRVVPGRNDKGIYLFGPTGTGKSLAMKLIEAIARTCNLKYVKDSSTHTLQWNTYRADELVDKFTRGDNLQSVKNESIICIEDLGSEPTEALYMGTRVNVLRNLLEQRGDKDGMLTLITSNLPLNSPELANKYGDRVVSRLCDMTNFLVLKGNDRRKRI